MPPLKNIKHEQFAQEVIRKDSLTTAYRDTYKIDNYKSATESASRLSSNVNVRERIQELLDRQGLSVPELNNRLHKWANDDLEPSTSLKAVEIGYKLHGLLGDREDNQPSAIEINLINLT